MTSGKEFPQTINPQLLGLIKVELIFLCSHVGGVKWVHLYVHRFSTQTTFEVRQMECTCLLSREPLYVVVWVPMINW